MKFRQSLLTLQFFISILIVLLMIVSCNDTKSIKEAKLPPRDTTVTVKNSFSPRFLDSNILENYIVTQKVNDSAANRLRAFYAQRNYQYAWFTDSSLAEYSSGFAEMLNNYLAYSKDSSMYDPHIHAWIDSFAVNPSAQHIQAEAQSLELLLSTQFFRYAYRVYEGRNNLNQQDLGWFIPKKKLDPVAVLDSMIAKRNNRFIEFEPLNPQYNLLKNELLRYDKIQSAFDSLPAITQKGKSPDMQEMRNLVKRLTLLGDYRADTTSTPNEDSIGNSVKGFQARHGLATTGTLSAATIKALNQSSQSRINQMLINLERLKWVPVQPATDYILVNIPEYRLHVYQQGKYQWSMNVVVGSDANSTVIFTGSLKYVVFSPYWNVPQSIIKKEIMPGMARNKYYLAQHNMEWNSGQVRQKPGPRNSLGLVKFLFPNSYSIYLHDTPSKSLFTESKRAFSHGCIRLAEPEKLAEFILRNDSAWTPQSIQQAMNAGKEKYVNVKENIPVFIGYFTAWVDRLGKLNFRDDIYGHDQKMAEKLFTRGGF